MRAKTIVKMTASPLAAIVAAARPSALPVSLVRIAVTRATMPAGGAGGIASVAAAASSATVPRGSVAASLMNVRR